MKTSFARKKRRVAFLLRAAAASLLITSVRGDANTQDRGGGGGGGGGDSFWDKFPGVITSCDFGGIEETEELDFRGTLTFLRPIICTTPTIAHIVTDTVIRSHGAIEASNLSFVVHDGAKLIVNAKKTIAFSRSEASTEPIFTIYGQVAFEPGGWTDSYVEASTEDEEGVMRFEGGGKLADDQSVRFTANSMIVVDVKAMNDKQGVEAEKELVKHRPINDDLLKAYHAAHNTASISSSSGSSSSSSGGGGGGSSGTDAAAEQQQDNKPIFEMRPPIAGGGVPTSPSPWTSFGTARKFARATRVAEPPVAGAPTAATADAPGDDVCEVPVGYNAALFDDPPRSEECSALENDNHDSDNGSYNGDGGDDNHNNNNNNNGTRTDSNHGNYNDDDDDNNNNNGSGYHDGAGADSDNGNYNHDNSDHDHEYSEPVEGATSLKVGEDLWGKMYSPDRTFAAWPGMDASVMHGRYPTDTPPPEDDGYIPRDMDLISTLYRSDHKKVWRALDLRAELKKEEEGEGEGLPQETPEGATWAWMPWGRPSERERERARQHMGEICMTLDDRACLRVTVDGATVLAKSGDRKIEFFNRFPWRRPRDDGYEAHVTPDGVEVRLHGKTVWGGAAAVGNARNSDSNTEAGSQKRTFWGVSAADSMD